MNDRTPRPDAEPPDAFWENELEMPVAALRATAESDDFMTEWLAERNGAQVAMFRHLLGLPGNVSTQAGRENPSEILERVEALLSRSEIR